jgi:hypothetical protein
MKRKVASVAEAVNKAGGTTAVAHSFGLVPSAVAGWKARGRVPARYVRRLAAMAAMKPEEIDPDTFGDKP